MIDDRSKYFMARSVTPKDPLLTRFFPSFYTHFKFIWRNGMDFGYSFSLVIKSACDSIHNITSTQARG